MKKYFIILLLAIVFIPAGIVVSSAFARQLPQAGYILEHEKDIAEPQSGPHNGGGSTTTYNFFSKANDCKLVFRKRVLHPGSSIGYHIQKEDEIYYIAGGMGKMKMNGETFIVNAGDAILTRPGSSHSLTQAGKDDLVVIINYEQH